MEASLEPLFLSLDMENKIGENKGSLSSSNVGSLWSKDLGAQFMRRRQVRKQKIKKMNGGYRWGKGTTRRALLVGSRRSMNGMEGKVKTLKKLVPNGKSSMGLDGLFSETADYIFALQLQVKVMQIMVEVLSGSDE
ncbi:hypothetical protein BVC80_1543g200 [Macleaya cordata]|uniref:Myc-type n=1 Tax=Macleaya cordata TaxID=56857 RepID=A0A200R204_MACCD|nr:hypothetical protein BVC80_1543g200 [Macleaya cordata]